MKVGTTHHIQHRETANAVLAREKRRNEHNLSQNNNRNNKTYKIINVIHYIKRLEDLRESHEYPNRCTKTLGKVNMSSW